MPFDKVVHTQQQNDGLYLSGLHHQIHPYKCALWSERKSEVISIGSSRVMQFRESHFSKPFTNAGLLLAELEDWEETEALFQHHKPKHVVFGIDWWWFNPVYNHTLRRKGVDPTKLTLSYLIRPIKGILLKKITLKEYLLLLFNKHASSHFGINAIVRDDGFGKDGSQYRNSLLFREKRNIPFSDKQFLSTLSKIVKGDHAMANRFDPFIKIDERRWKRFTDIVDAFKKHDIEVFYFLTPSPPEVIDRMLESRRYPALKELENKLDSFFANRDEQYLNAHDPRMYGSNNCEMLDGLHAGEVCYLRMLDKANLPYVNIESNRKRISQFAGCAAAYTSKYGTERDFLEMGCTKPQAAA